MITIYHAKRARSARVIWLLEELGVPYALEPIEFKAEVLRSPAYLRLHPLGLLPVVKETGADASEVTFFESGAIVQYLLEKHGQGRLEPKPGCAERALYLQWFHFGEASLAAHTTQIVRQRFGVPAEAQSAAILEDGRARLRAALSVVEHTLSDRPYICGAEFSAADIMISYGIVMARVVRELPPEFVGVAAYLDRLKERPAYAKAWA
jgi:glutathione S-transferase